MNIGIITQARINSTRLPAKILKMCNGKPMLDYHIERLQWSNLPIYIATSTNPADQAIANYAQQHQLPFYCGSEDDVLSRFYGCATTHNLDIIVRVTSDCPLIDGMLVKQGVDYYMELINQLQNTNVYLSNSIERTFPRGFDFEIFHFDMLEQAYHQAIAPAQREHVTPYFYQNPQLFDLHCMMSDKDKSHYRITLDTPEDLQMILTLIEQYHADALSTDQLITLLDDHPEIVAINAHIEQKKL